MCLYKCKKMFDKIYEKVVERDRRNLVMDIMVEGTGKRYYKPDEVIINLNFYTKAGTYGIALEDGTRDVEIFIEDVLRQMQFKQEDLKTRSFRIYEETRYDYERKLEVKLGFAYTQNATLKFDYDINVVAEFMEKTSKLKNPPKYTISFNVKNEQQCKNEAMTEAYNKAKEKAMAIANASGKILKECIKTDFRPFEERVNSYSRLGSEMFETERMTDFSIGAKKMSAQDKITNIFTPEDIEISETLYCLWITE